MIFYGRKAKSDKNDILFSEIVRMPGKCVRCGKTSSLTCAHIMKRRYYSTRFEFRNAICLCLGCHSWFDTHMITDLLFSPKKRVLDAADESYTFLVEKLGYTWDELTILYAKSKQHFTGYAYKKDQIYIGLKELRGEMMETVAVRKSSEY